MDKILTVNDVAAILQVKAITVREMFREQRLRGFKVGKAWRTTETMLQEDIAALARGESPAVLPMPKGPGDATSPESPKAGVPVAPAPRAAEPAARPRPARKPAVPSESDADEDDTQQLLF